MSLQPDDRVLEVGPGPGDLMERIAAMVTRGSVTGVDFSPEMINVCKKRFAPLGQAGRVELSCANAEALPCAADQFTKACTVNTIYFWPEPAAVVCELWRVLRTGGRLVLSFRPRVTLKRLSAPPAFALYDGDQVARLLEHAGFRNLRLIRGEDRRGEHLGVVGDKRAA